MIYSRPLAVVTGAKRGIGLAIAKALADHGFNIAMIEYCHDENSQNAVATLRDRGAQVLLQIGDIANLEQHDSLVAHIITQFGQIDCLVNNAGIGAVERGDFLDLKPENFDHVLATNLRGTVFLTQAMLKAMLAPQSHRQPKSIINITSISAQNVSPERLDYCISKAALSSFTAGLALRLAAENIAVFEVQPGIIQTDMTKMVADKYEKHIREGLVPMRRWGQAQDIGDVVAALASGKFAFATGSVIHVDGGLAIAKL